MLKKVFYEEMLYGRKCDMKKYEMINEYATYTAYDIVRNEENWKKYLTTASRLYKYPFKDQLLIYAQRPSATACASMEIWNKKMFCWVNRNAKGIALLDEKSDTGLKYVFDVSDVHRGGRGSSLPYLWSMEKEHQKVVLERLEALYGQTTKKAGFPKRIQELAERIAESVSEGLQNDLEKMKKGSTLEHQSAETIKKEFHHTLSNSIAYSILKRCGIAENILNKTIEFPYIHHFNTMQTLSQLGTNVSALTKPILTEIGKTVMEYDKTHTRNKKSVAEKLKTKQKQGIQREATSKCTIEEQDNASSKDKVEIEAASNPTEIQNCSVLKGDMQEQDNSKEKNPTSTVSIKIEHQEELAVVSHKVSEMLLVAKMCQELGRSTVIDWNENTQSIVIRDADGTVEGKEVYDILFSEAADYIIEQTYNGNVQKGLDMADLMGELRKYASRYREPEVIAEQTPKALVERISIKEKLDEKKAEILKREQFLSMHTGIKGMENIL